MMVSCVVVWPLAFAGAALHYAGQTRLCMPKLEKLYTLEITVEQFLKSCSYEELQEVSLMIDNAIRIKQRDEAVKRNRYYNGGTETLPYHD